MRNLKIPKLISINILSNYLGQGYVAIIGIVTAPLYLKYLGAEYFGLYSIFLLLRTWSALLDFGLIPTMARQVVIAKSQIGSNFFPKLLRTIEYILFIAVILTISTSTFFMDTLIAFLIPENALSYNTNSNSLFISLFIFSISWFSSLYRGGIIALEKQLLINTLSILITTIRHACSISILIFYESEIVIFLMTHAGFFILETLIYAFSFYRLIRRNKVTLNYYKFYYKELFVVLPFALSAGYSSMIWLAITQIHKIVLLSYLDLEEFGYFSMVSTLAGGILLLGRPIHQAILPRLTEYATQSEMVALSTLYSRSIELVILICFSTAFILGLNSKLVLYLWTENLSFANWGKQYLFWLCLGNAFLTLGTFQYLIQAAFGNLKLHTIGSTVSLIIQIPLIIYLTREFGPIGAAISWFSFRMIWFFIWTYIVHEKFLPKFHWGWLLKSVLPSIFIIIFVTLSISTLYEVEVGSGFMKSVCILVLAYFSALITSLIFIGIFKRFKTWIAHGS